MHDALDQRDTWTHLCKIYWLATESRLKEWPCLSPKGLYRTLEHWVPLEGYYSLASAFPWGLPVLLRIAEGHVTADVIRFIPCCDGSFEEVFTNLFTISFVEEGASVQSCFAAEWLGDAIAEISSLDPQSLSAHTSVGRRIFSSPDIGANGMLRARQALRVTTSSTDVVVGDEDDEDDSDDDFGALSRDPEVWQPGELLSSRESAKNQTARMLMAMFSGRESKPCDLALISSPSEFVPKSEDFLGLRSGLYVGDYGHNFYGQYRTEVLLLEYVSLTPDEIQQEIAEPSSIFARPGKEKAPKNLEKMLTLGTPVEFVRGVKQCGDIHVPMGATTFVAVCGPAAACEMLAQQATPPTVLLNRQTNKSEQVVRAWRGFGTLAMPGFHQPSWADGWLVQFEDSPNGFHRFGFAWDRNQDAVVLQWISAQDTHPFLQRAWLPEDLQ